MYKKVGVVAPGTDLFRASIGQNPLSMCHTNGLSTPDPRPPEVFIRNFLDASTVGQLRKYSRQAGPL